MQRNGETVNKPISGIFEGLMLHFRGGRLVVLTTSGYLAGMLEAVEKATKKLIRNPFKKNTALPRGLQTRELKEHS